MYDCSMIREHYQVVSAFPTVAQGTKHIPPYVMMVLESYGPLQTKGYPIMECPTAL